MLDLKMGFGKYKDMYLHEIPTNYLKWVLTIVPDNSKLAVDVNIELGTRSDNYDHYYVEEDYDNDLDYDNDSDYDDEGEYFHDPY